MSQAFEICVDGTTIFSEEYNYWKSQGYNHTSAKNKAIDYYRKYTSREVTVDWQIVADQVECHEDHIQDKIQVNDVIRVVLTKLTKRQTEFLFYVIWQQDLDQYLDQDLLDIAALYVKGRPSEVKDIANYMGIALNSIGVAIPITKMRQRIRKVFDEAGFSLASLITK